MTTRSSVVRRVSHAIFRRLPPGIRRLLVRLLTPNYTLGAVVLVRDAAGSLLLLRQPRSAEWSLPGGLIDRGEAPTAAAVRELAEETGLVVTESALTPGNPSARISVRAQQVDVVFAVSLPEVEPALVLDPIEVSAARWYPLDALPPLTAPTARLVAPYGIGPLGVHAAGPEAIPATGPDVTAGADVPTDRESTPAPDARAASSPNEERDGSQ